MVEVRVLQSGAIYCVVDFNNKEYIVQIEWLQNIRNNAAQINRTYLTVARQVD